MKNGRFISIIGTSKTATRGELDYIKKVSCVLATVGYTIRTGRAEQVDFAAMEGAMMVGEDMLEVYLPWETYNKHLAIGGKIIFYSPHRRKWLDSVQEFHPNPSVLSQGARELHARNFPIIMGEDGETPSVLVIALPRPGSKPGGTGQGLRIAEAYNIPVINLRTKEGRLEMDRQITNIYNRFFKGGISEEKD